MTKEEKEKRKLEKQKIKEEKKAQKLARKEEKRIAKLKRKGLYTEPEPPVEEPQEEVVVEEEEIQEESQEELVQEEETVPEPEEKKEEEKPVQQKRKAPKQYHISLRVDNKWQLKFGGSSKALKLFDTQKEAIEYAKPLAAKQKAALVIHKTDGKIRKQDYTKK